MPHNFLNMPNPNKLNLQLRFASVLAHIHILFLLERTRSFSVRKKIFIFSKCFLV